MGCRRSNSISGPSRLERLVDFFEWESRASLMKRVAMGIHRPRKPWSTEALLAGVKNFCGDKEAG